MAVLPPSSQTEAPPAHHLPHDALLAYAAGGATDGEDLLAACHLTLCPACRQAVDDAERVGAVLLDQAEPVSLESGALDALFAAIDREPAPAPAPAPLQRCTVFPAPLVRRIGALDALPWRKLIADVRVAQIGDSDGQRTFLLDFPPSLRIPVHGHHGFERALVLRGGYTDENGSYARGDVSWREDGGHDVRIDPDGRCTTLFVNDGPADYGMLTSAVDWMLR